jgi:hypothetical protein
MEVSKGPLPPPPNKYIFIIELEQRSKHVCLNEKLMNNTRSGFEQSQILGHDHTHPTLLSRCWVSAWPHRWLGLRTILATTLRTSSSSWMGQPCLYSASMEVAFWFTLFPWMTHTIYCRTCHRWDSCCSHKRSEFQWEGDDHYHGFWAIWAQQYCDVRNFWGWYP